VWVIWAGLDGGFDPDRFGLLGVLLVVALALAVAIVPPRLRTWERTRTVMVASLVALVLWSFLSMAWADFPGDAWIGSAKTLLYAAGMAFFACWPWSTTARLAMLVLFTVGVIAVGLATLVEASLGGGPTAVFEEARLVATMGYANAAVALWMLAFFPAVYLGSTRALPAVARPFFLGGASLLLDLAVLGQSRAWLYLSPFALAAMLLLARERLRTLLGAVLAAAGTAAVLRPLLDVYGDADRGIPLAESVDRAVLLSLAATIGVIAIGAAVTFADTRVRVPHQVQRGIGIALAVACVAAVVGTATVAATRDPGAWIAARWEEFKGGGPSGEAGSYLGETLGSHRYEEWSIAWEEFRGHPIIGIGTDNFQASYVLRRTDGDHNPLYPHSIPLRLLSQLGVIGTALFVTVVVAGLTLALRQRRRLDPLAGGAVAAATMVFVYWMLHGSVDWFWEMPALGATAFGMLGLAGARVPTEEISGEPQIGPNGHGLRRTLTLAIVGLVALASVAALVLPWLSHSYRRAGARVWVVDPETAYDRLELAARLDPLGADALIVEGSIALRQRQLDHAQEALERALEREPMNWYAYLQLGLVASLAGDHDEAERRIRRAAELNPLDPGVVLALQLVETGSEIDPEAVNSVYLPEQEAVEDRG
jgi:hypothetical protein